ncbi:MAG: ABC transporter ATP-binding protein, partial [Acidimicrobiia bacterium]
MAAAIEIEGLCKSFRLYREKYNSVKERMLNLGRNRYQEFKALDDINLAVEAGTTVGLLGHNGSGKSTLLKCIAGIILPNQGKITTRGRIASLLELGAGFDPDLPARDNILMNAAILGVTRHEAQRRIPEILEFAEVEQFVNNPLRHYSSGMY